MYDLSTLNLFSPEIILQMMVSDIVFPFEFELYKFIALHPESTSQPFSVVLSHQD